MVVQRTPIPQRHAAAATGAAGDSIAGNTRAQQPDQFHHIGNNERDIQIVDRVATNVEVTGEELLHQSLNAA